MTVTSCLHHK